MIDSSRFLIVVSAILFINFGSLGANGSEIPIDPVLGRGGPSRAEPPKSSKQPTYTIYNPPQDLNDHKQFKHYVLWSHRYWTIEKAINTLEYLSGLAASTCLTIARWDVTDDQQKKTFDDVGTALVYATGVLECVSLYSHEKYKGYKKEARAILSRHLEQPSPHVAAPPQDTLDP